MSENPLSKLQTLLEKDMERVRNLIHDRMYSEHAPLIPKITDHLITAGGKRLRPMLTLASAKMFDYSGDFHIHLAAIVEFIHTATLLHDDVIDESTKRRGRATANAIWDNKTSVLVGDYLFARAFQLMVEIGSIKILDSLSKASAEISESEVLQMSLSRNIKTTEEQYMRVIKGKTATLFSSACEVGGLIAKVESDKLNAVRRYGEALGISFQIVDDFLDYDGHGSDLGKNIGDDFRERKITLPIIRSLSKNESSSRTFWIRTLERGEQEKEDLAIACNILREDHSLEKTFAEALHWSEIAKNQLNLLPKGEINDLLVELADFVVSRTA